MLSSLRGIAYAPSGLKQLVDLVAQRIGEPCLDAFLQRGSDNSLLLQLPGDDGALLLEFAASDDLAIDFGDDLFHDVDFRPGSIGREKRGSGAKSSSQQDFRIHM